MRGVLASKLLFLSLWQLLAGLAILVDEAVNAHALFAVVALAGSIHLRKN